jgi:hypothetical protein
MLCRVLLSTGTLGSHAYKWFQSSRQFHTGRLIPKMRRTWATTPIIATGSGPSFSISILVLSYLAYQCRGTTLTCTRPLLVILKVVRALFRLVGTAEGVLTNPACMRDTLPGLSFHPSYFPCGVRWNTLEVLLAARNSQRPAIGFGSTRGYMRVHIEVRDRRELATRRTLDKLGQRKYKEQYLNGQQKVNHNAMRYVLVFA